MPMVAKEDSVLVFLAPFGDESMQHCIESLSFCVGIHIIIINGTALFIKVLIIIFRLRAYLYGSRAGLISEILLCSYFYSKNYLPFTGLPRSRLKEARSRLLG
jgi:hypothetical protein